MCVHVHGGGREGGRERGRGGGREGGREGGKEGGKKEEREGLKGNNIHSYENCHDVIVMISWANEER